jgi:hypothetical protein
LTDASGNVTILVPKSMTFTDNRVFVEYFTYHGRDMFICRTAVRER